MIMKTTLLPLTGLSNPPLKVPSTRPSSHTLRTRQSVLDASAGVLLNCSSENAKPTLADVAFGPLLFKSTTAADAFGRGFHQTLNCGRDVMFETLALGGG